MKSEIIDSCAEDLAKEISERTLFNIDEVKTLISIKFKLAFVEILNEYAGQNESEYSALLLQQSKHRIGSKQYIETGYKLALAKSKKAVSNRMQNQIQQSQRASKNRNNGELLSYDEIELL